MHQRVCVRANELRQRFRSHPQHRLEPVACLVKPPVHQALPPSVDLTGQRHNHRSHPLYHHLQQGQLRRCQIVETVHHQQGPCAPEIGHPCPQRRHRQPTQARAVRPSLCLQPTLIGLVDLRYLNQPRRASQGCYPFRQGFGPDHARLEFPNHPLQQADEARPVRQRGIVPQIEPLNHGLQQLILSSLAQLGVDLTRCVQTFAIQPA